jgi:hypothetical protein
VKEARVGVRVHYQLGELEIAVTLTAEPSFQVSKIGGSISSFKILNKMVFNV